MGRVGRPSKYPGVLKEAVLKEFRESDLNDIEVCAKHDVNVRTFRWWCYADPELHKLLRIRMRTHLKKHTYSAEERILAVESFKKSGLSLVNFSKVFGVSQGSLSSWRNIYDNSGPQGLSTEPIRNNPRGRKAIDDGLKEEIKKVKNENPSFGLRKVRDFLKRFKGVKVSHKTVGKTLKENNIPLLPGPKARRKRAKIRRFERAKPMQLWQSDITSYMLTRHARRVYLTVFMDDHSRYIVAWNLQLRQTNELVMDCLLNGIQNFGKPEEVLTDQGRQYFAWRGKSEFKKILDREGIAHVVSRSHHPQTLGKCERFWETVKNELWERAKPQELGEARERLKHFINHYNHFRPHQGLDGMVPADRFFGVEKEVRERIEMSIGENALRMSLGELPRVPVFLVGQIGDQSISLHGESGQLVINTSDGVTKTIDYEKFGHGKEQISGARKKAEGPQKRESNEGAADGDSSEGALDGSNEGTAGQSSVNGDVFDGILAGPKNKETNFSGTGASTSENLAVVTAGDIGDVSGVIEATETERSGFDIRRESENTIEEDCRTGEAYSDAGPLDRDTAGNAGLQGCKNTDGTKNESGSEASWSKEKPDTDGSSS
ncbi:MAG: hypothetical protein A2622_07360 [Bdellovibrionales bacterium RIFCSPHIGHO2_01_FULL_40_29]|nr:MAG: hypothetical protein A2622_07360 [Bdellovibrionales bacterium RIFCSPHIGHO2_01_FULL_40_29]